MAPFRPRLPETFLGKRYRGSFGEIVAEKHLITQQNPYPMKNILLILLLMVAVVMIVLGARASILPPALTGVGFILIALLLYNKKH